MSDAIIKRDLASAQRAAGVHFKAIDLKVDFGDTASYANIICGFPGADGAEKAIAYVEQWSRQATSHRLSHEQVVALVEFVRGETG